MDEGKKDKPCGKPCEIYSRVTGYLTPVSLPTGVVNGGRGSQWNRGKQEEFKDRKMYSLQRNGSFIAS